jgi:hypothetical protein
MKGFIEAIREDPVVVAFVAGVLILGVLLKAGVFVH